MKNTRNNTAIKCNENFCSILEQGIFANLKEQNYFLTVKNPSFQLKLVNHNISAEALVGFLKFLFRCINFKANYKEVPREHYYA
ncbi:hypothetical protein BpHYR1_044444 [Brachionus plicatilis]|uniref:Uncharacterized protein n=1 Tax=Brachionus plicatilis TaxID=10195 RepID=A0A3M7QS49_BRAPC|nr:hypothetical protein BpHYR1_044444 [Brachionus plicatilis]